MIKLTAAVPILACAAYLAATCLLVEAARRSSSVNDVDPVTDPALLATANLVVRRGQETGQIQGEIVNYNLTGVQGPPLPGLDRNELEMVVQVVTERKNPTICTASMPPICHDQPPTILDYICSAIVFDNRPLLIPRINKGPLCRSIPDPLYDESVGVVGHPSKYSSQAAQGPASPGSTAHRIPPGVPAGAAELVNAFKKKTFHGQVYGQVIDYKVTRFGKFKPGELFIAVKINVQRGIRMTHELPGTYECEGVTTDVGRSFVRPQVLKGPKCVLTPPASTSNQTHASGRRQPSPGAASSAGSPVISPSISTPHPQAIAAGAKLLAEAFKKQTFQYPTHGSMDNYRVTQVETYPFGELEPGQLYIELKINARVGIHKTAALPKIYWCDGVTTDIGRTKMYPELLRGPRCSLEGSLNLPSLGD